MTDVGELERDLEKLFARKAAAVRPCREPLTITHPSRPKHRGRWALAAAVFVLVGVVTGSVLLIDRDETVTTEPEPTAATSLPTTDAPIPTTAPPPTDPFDQVVGFAPTEGIPDGWIVTHASFDGVPGTSWATRQLFGDADAPQPMNRSVLVISAVNPYAPTSAATTLAPSDVIRGAAASIVSNGDGTVHIQWASGENLHLATVRGMDQAEAVAFIESLQARAEPSDGFDAAPGMLVEIASATPALGGQSFHIALRPAGSTPDTRGPNVTVFASSAPDSLEFRALATPEPDGTLVIRGEVFYGRHSVRALRTDGWEVRVEVGDVDGFALPSAMIDAIRAGLQPVTGRELIDTGQALPVMEEADVDGQHITVHGMVRGGLLSEVSDPTPSVPPRPPTDVPGDQWSIVDVRDDAWLVTIASKEGGGAIGRPLP